MKSELYLKKNDSTTFHGGVLKNGNNNTNVVQNSFAETSHLGFGSGETWLWTCYGEDRGYNGLYFAGFECLQHD